MIERIPYQTIRRYGKNAGGKLDSGKSNTPFPGDSGGDDDRPVIE